MKIIDRRRATVSDHLDKLEAFRVVAQHGSVTRAARQLGLTQSALSHLVAKLEDALELKLFERQPRGLLLTEAGTELFEFSKRLRVDLESLVSRVSSANGRSTTRLRIGTHETLASHVWPRIISHFDGSQRSYVSFSLTTGRVDALINSLLQRDLHLAMTVEPKADPRLRIRSLYEGSLEFFISPARKLSSISVSELRDFRVFTDSSAHTRQGVPIPHALHETGISSLGTVEVSSFEAAINFASSGLGIAVIPDRNARQAVRERRLVPLRVHGLKAKSLLKYNVCLTTLARSENGDLYDRFHSDLKPLLA